jgi:hypothetical protein
MGAPLYEPYVYTRSYRTGQFVSFQGHVYECLQPTLFYESPKAKPAKWRVAFDVASAVTSVTSVTSATSTSATPTSSEFVSLQNRVSALSGSLSAEVINRISADNALSAAINVVSAALSAETAGRISSDNALSVAIGIVSAQVAANSTQMTSVDNALSNAISVISAVLSDQGSAIIANSADMTSLKNRVGANSALLSDALSAIGANSAQMTSADNAVSAAAASKNRIISVANHGSVLVTNPEKLDFTGNAVSTYLSGSTVKIQISTVAGTASVTSAEYLSLVDRVSGNSTQMTSADNALSNAISVVSAQVGANSAQNTSTEAVLSSRINAVVNNVSQLSVTVSAISTRLSSLSSQVTSLNAVKNRIVSVANHSSVINTNPERIDFTGNAVSAYLSGSTVKVDISVTAGGASVTSAEYLSLVNRVSAVSTDVTSVKSVVDAGGGLWVVVQNEQGISATTLTNVSGLSLTLSAGGIYKIEGMLLNRMSVTNTYRLGATWPAMVSGEGGGFWQGALSIGNNASVRLGVFNETGSGSVTFSIAAAANVMPIKLDAVFHTSATGTFQVQAAASVNTSPLLIKAGSYIRAYKIGSI